MPHTGGGGGGATIGISTGRGGTHDGSLGHGYPYPVWIAYMDDAGTKYGINLDLSVFDLLLDYIRTTDASMPSTLLNPASLFQVAFLNLSDLQAVSGWSGAIALPTGYQARKLVFEITEADGLAFSRVSAPVGYFPDYAALLPAASGGAYSQNTVGLDWLSVAIVQMYSEIRSSN